MTKVTALFTILIGALSTNLAATDSGLQTALTSKYEHTVLILRRPVDSNHQKYSANGALLSGGKEAPWTVAGAIEISKILVTPEMLKIEGKQEMLAFDEKKKAMVPFKKDRHNARVEILLDSPLRSADEAETIMHSIFAMNEAELVDCVPDYWRSFLVKHGQRKQQATSAPPSRPVESDLTEGTPNQDPNKVYRFDAKSITAPQPVFTPAPRFSDEAKHARFQGIVVLSAIVDSAGKVTRPRIVRPLGLGLDEKAVEAVQTWKFKPATREGKPVAIEMGLEITFNLY
jgi:TonB family protein